MSLGTLVFCAILSCTPVESSELLWIVGRDTPLAAEYVPTALVQYNGITLHEEARDAFVDMLAAMGATEIHGLRLQSAYRPYNYQRAIFDQRVNELMRTGFSKEEATYKASQSVQPPGASEHQTGLALDVSIDGILSQKFADTGAGRWLAENCHNYGFIIRYPENKTDVTKIIYEPWHLRYVGNPHAQIIKNLDLTLEEYWCYIYRLQTLTFEEGDKWYLFVYSNEFPCATISDANIVFSSKQGENAVYIIMFTNSYPAINVFF